MTWEAIVGVLFSFLTIMFMGVGNIAFYTIVSEINKFYGYPKVSHYGFHFGKLVTILSEYKKIYPKGTYYRIFLFMMTSVFVSFAISIIFLFGLPN